MTGQTGRLFGASGSMRFAAALVATVLAIMLLPFAVPVLGRVGGVSAFASGTVVHADLLQTEGTKLVDAEVGFSGAAYNSGGLKDTIFNEMDRILAPSLPGKLGFGRGAAIEVGLGVSPTTENQAILAGKAEASALPNVAPVSEGAGPIDVDPLVWVDLLRGQAAANVADDGCALGRDASNGFAYVADAQLLDMASQAAAQQQSAAAPTPAAPAEPAESGVETVTKPVEGLLGALGAPTESAGVVETQEASPPPPASQNTQAAAAMPNVAGLEQPLIALDADGPARAVSHSRSRTVFIAQRGRDGRLLGNAFGIMSEVRQTIAPVTLFKDTPNELTLELLGEWVLQATAGGVPGTGYIHYGPGKITPDTPVLRTIDAAGVTKILSFQDLFTNDGLVLTIPGVAEIAIGEPPRAIDGAAGSDPVVARGGTFAAAAVDVIRLKVLPGAPAQIADLRLGHMEVQSQVPAGGISCDIPVDKTASVDQVDVGKAFDVTFKVTNPYDCTLTDVRLEDVITTEDESRFTVIATSPAASTSPAGDALDSGTIIWSDIGDLAPRSSRTITAAIGARGGAGTIIDKATATGTLANCAEGGVDVAGVDVGVVGSALTGTSEEVRVPAVTTRVLAESSRRLPFTGAHVLYFIATALVMLAIGGASLLQAKSLRLDAPNRRPF